MSYLIDKNSIEEWDYNSKFRSITDKGEKQLEANLELGQHSTLLVWKTPEERLISVGGNRRLRRMKQMNYEDIDCTILEFGQDDEGFYATFNGRVYKDAEGRIPRHFETVEQGLLEIAFSHNTSPGFNNAGEVGKIAAENPRIEWWKYEAQFVEKVSIADIQQGNTTPNNPPAPAGSPFKIQVVFENQDDFDSGVIDIEQFLQDNYPAAIIKFKKGGR